MTTPSPRAAVPPGPSESKAGRFRSLLKAPALNFLMEAHDGLSAKIVEEAGFPGIWASGLTVSAALGVRDSNEASWTQVLEMLEFMADATSVPILLDGDTGYGNFNSVRRLVRKLGQRGVAAVCLEDKLFPKTNSFIGEHQPLADVDEFCGKIKAGKDSATDPNFSIVARVEALIAGRGLDEALRRAEAYHAAGADAILIHSKRQSADEILGFAAEWGGRGPLVIVPTMYYATPTDVFRRAGISVVIWANHNLRAAISAMREVSRRIHADESLVGVEGTIASVREVFALAGNWELEEAERRYLGPPPALPHAIVIAASRGAALGPLTAERPKCMIDVRGQPLLRRLCGTLRDCGVGEITVVRGYQKEAINLPSIATVDNDAYATTGEAASLACARDRLEGPCILSYGDILFRRHLLDTLLATEGDVVVAVDALPRNRADADPDRVADLVGCSRRYTADYLEQEQPVWLSRIGNDLRPAEADGEWIGLVKLTAHGAALVRAELGAMDADGSLGQASLLEMLSRLIAAGHRIGVAYVLGGWLDVDDAFDLARARNFT
jgi:phosphoenolpyruvate phosphomutase